MNKQLLIAGALLGCLGGVSGVACSSSGSGTGGSGAGVGPSTTTASPTTTTGSPTTTTLSSSTTGMGGAGPSTTTGPGPSTTTSGGGAGGSVTTVTSSSSSSSGECSKVTTLHPPNLDAGPGTIFCPFSGLDGGENLYCTGQSQHCCEITCTPPCTSPPSTCEAEGTACPQPPAGDSIVDWGCEDPGVDCASGQDCCAAGASIGLGTPGCGNFAHKMTGTACVAKGTCTSGIVMCTSDGECPSPMKCTPFGKGGNQVGGCM